MGRKRKQSTEATPELLAALDWVLSARWDFFNQLEPFGYHESQIEMLWHKFGREWLDAGRWRPENFPTVGDRPEVEQMFGPPG
jgi:hypothetical protein